MPTATYFDHLDDEIRERIQWYIKEKKVEDTQDLQRQLEDDAHELIDGCVPIYYGDLANALSEDIGLAQVDDEGLLPENPTVWQIIQTAIYERLTQHFYETIEGEIAMQREAWLANKFKFLPDDLFDFVMDRGSEEELYFKELINDLKDNVYNDQLTMNQIDELLEALT